MEMEMKGKGVWGKGKHAMRDISDLLRPAFDAEAIARLSVRETQSACPAGRTGFPYA
jgi:hypothetical protein